MIFARNDLVLLPDDDERYRLLATVPSANAAFLIATSPGRHMPFEVDLALFLEQCRAGQVLPAPVVAASRVVAKTPKSEAKAIRDWESIRDLVLHKEGPDGMERIREDIFHPALRHGMVKKHAKRTGVAISTLYARLGRWWVGGQVRDALVSAFHRRGGKSLVEGVRSASRKNGEANKLLCVTSNRGSKPKNGRRIYQWSAHELIEFRDSVLRAREKKPNAPLTKLFEAYCDRRHFYLDGNGVSHLKPAGERPSTRQMYIAFNALIPYEDRKRAQVGAKRFEKDHRGKSGSAQQDCDGIGHQYEIDATVGDVWLRSTVSPGRIAGKPTIVLIVDRKSYLIVGFYVGYEQDSWLSSREAIFSIFEDKSALCARYGIPYDPDDWAAHRVLPLLFLADRGPLAAQESSIIVGGLSRGIKNLPTERPDWKPYVECAFKLLRRQLTTEDGYEPPNQAERRRGKKYALDAQMNLHEFTALLLSLIIAHNRRPGTEDHLTGDQVLRGVQAIPTEIWRDEEVNRIGLLARVDESVARASLMHREKAVIESDGILFRGAYYTCPSAVKDGWFSQARLGRKTIFVRYDRRLCDSIYVELAKEDGHVPLEVASLTGNSVQYRGLSFAEMKVVVEARKDVERESEELRAQVDHQTRQRNEKLKAPYQNRDKIASKAMSGAAQMRDIKGTRQAERSEERKQRAAAPSRALPESASVLPFQRKSEEPPALPVVAKNSVLDRIHEEMLDDDLPY